MLFDLKNDMEEIWKTVKGYNGYYQVSNTGKVRNPNKVLTPNVGVKNGYVAVPSANKYHGMSYFDIDDISVHGGITFSEPAISGEESIGSKRKINSKYVGKRNPILDDVEFITDNTEIGDDWWIFGFDTFHYGDNEYDWDKQAVVQETRYLMKQLDK